jgi:type I restriction enzyme S subunit
VSAVSPNTLPSGWAADSLGTVVDILDSQRVPINSEERAKRLGKVPYYGATGQVGWIDDHLFDEELVLLGEDGAPFLDSSKAKAYLIEGRSWVNNHAHVLRGKNGISNRFLMYQLNQVNYREFVSGTTRLKLPQAPMRQIPLVIAPEEEQKRIVAEIEKQFTRLDAAIAGLKRVQASLKRYRASVLKATCEGRLVPTEAELARREGRSYEPASVLLERILAERRVQWKVAQQRRSAKTGRGDKWQPKYEEPICNNQPGRRALPEGWAWVPLDSMLREPLRNGHSAKSVDGASGVPTFTLSAVTYGDFSPTNVKNTSADPRKVEDLWVEPGDIFIERSNTPELVGTARLFSGQARMAIFPDLLIRIRVVNCVLPSYIELALQSSPSREFFRRSAQGISGTMPKIDQGIVQQVMIPLPPFAEQERITNTVEDQFSVIQHAEAELEGQMKKAESLRQSILKCAFQGKLAPQDLNDEPATALLERIRAGRENAQVTKRRAKEAQHVG